MAEDISTRAEHWSIYDNERFDDVADFWVIMRLIIFFPGPEGPPWLRRTENLHMQNNRVSQRVSKLTTNASLPFSSGSKRPFLTKN
jgi:hypothetical protein